MTTPFRIGQTVRIAHGEYPRQAAGEVYTIVRRNETDSSDPSYVIENKTDRRQRRELQSRLLPIEVRGDFDLRTGTAKGTE